MDDVFLGEVRLTAITFAPAGWAFCNGQLLSINDYPSLYQLIGTTYGGDGQSNFALPDLRGRVPIHQGSGYVLAATGGAETVTLTSATLPAHSHPAMGAPEGTAGTPAGNFWGGDDDLMQYSGSGTGNEGLAAASIGVAGQGQSHDNMIPYLALNYLVAVTGQYPVAG